MTEVLRPLRLSAIHFTKSCDGAVGASSFGVVASLIAAGTAGGRVDGVVLPFRAVVVGTAVALTVGTDFDEATVASVGRAGSAAEAAAAAAVAALVLPPAPTVVHAPPVCGAFACTCEE